MSFGGNYPYVVRTSDNNGIRGYIDEDTQFLNPGKTISFGQDTATIFYQETPYFTGDKIKILTPRFEIDRLIAVYFLACMRKSFSNFQWGVSSFNVAILNQIMITLPINKYGDIDFAFIEARIQEMEQARIQEMEQARIQEMDAYLKVAGFENCELTEEETKAVNDMHNRNVVYKSFYVTDDKNRIDGIFNVYNSHNILQSSIVKGSGTTPYVTAGEGNNSILTYISFDKSQLEEGNCIMIGGKTMVITYQSDDFFSNDSHNLVLYTKDDCLRKELTQLFLVASLNKSLKPIYSWGDSISNSKIKKDRIHLPVTSSGEIDYHFMETYIRAQEKLAIQRVKDWRSKEISATRDIVESKQQGIKSVKFSLHIDADVDESKKFTTHLPVYPLRAACGYLDNAGKLQSDDAEGWVDVSERLHNLNKGMFIVHAEGASMEPKIHDGDLCVFDLTGGGSREGKTVLVKAKDKSDPSASSYAIKVYSSKKSTDEDGGWHHSQIVLSPLNSAFSPIVINEDEVEDGEFKVFGELVEVLKS